jgi:uncharacterized protein
VPDRWEDGEERWHAIGRVGGATLLVVHAYLDDDDDDDDDDGDTATIRIISARRATPHERRAYEEA